MVQNIVKSGIRSLERQRDLVQLLVQGFAGSCLIAIGAKIAVPAWPVPVTMQTLAVLFLALVQSPRAALLSSFLYLTEAAIGLPVLANYPGAETLWIFRPTAGYLVGFPVASWIMTSLLSRDASVIRQFVVLCLGHLLILSLGYCWLCAYVGKIAAFSNGVLLFMPGSLLKVACAIASVRVYRALRYEQ